MCLVLDSEQRIRIINPNPIPSLRSEAPHCLVVKNLVVPV